MPSVYKSRINTLVDKFYDVGYDPNRELGIPIFIDGAAENLPGYFWVDFREAWIRQYGIGQYAYGTQEHNPYCDCGLYDNSADLVFLAMGLGSLFRAGIGVVARQIAVRRAARQAALQKAKQEGASIAAANTVRNVGTIQRSIPRGFSSAEQFQQVGDELAVALNESGIVYSRIGVRGSSVTGTSSKGTPFRYSAENGLSPSDIDVFIELSSDIGVNASKNIPGFIHPGKLFKRFPALQKWSNKWTKELGREITPGAFEPGTFTDINTISF